MDQFIDYPDKELAEWWYSEQSKKLRHWCKQIDKDYEMWYDTINDTCTKCRAKLSKFSKLALSLGCGKTFLGNKGR